MPGRFMANWTFQMRIAILVVFVRGEVHLFTKWDRRKPG
jgi:hypothetical protein